MYGVWAEICKWRFRAKGKRVAEQRGELSLPFEGMENL